VFLKQGVLMIELNEDVVELLTQMCGHDPSPRLRRITAHYLRVKHQFQGGPPNLDVLALACAITQDVSAEPKPVLNPFAGTARGTALEVLRVGSKEVDCVGFLMDVGEGVNAALVQVAMHDSEEEAAWFPFDQVRLRAKAVPVVPSEPQSPLVVVHDPVELTEQTVESRQSVPEIVEEDDEDAIDEPQLTVPQTSENVWSLVEDGQAVWMDDGREGEFRGIDGTTGHLMVSVSGVHRGSQFSLYLPDQVRLSEEIPVEHDPVDVGYQELPDREKNPYSLEAAGAG
jgi:hypothetical protein